MESEKESWKKVLHPTQACLSLQELSGFHHKQVDASTRARIEAHLQGCAHCMTELALYREFESPAANAQEEESVNWITAQLRERSPGIFEALDSSAHPTVRKAEGRFSKSKRLFSLRRVQVAALAAALLIVGALGLLSERSPEISAPAGDPTPPVLRSGNIEIVFPSGDLVRAPEQLAWKAAEGAAKYQVSLLEVDRVELWKDETAGTSIPIPERIQAQIVPGKKLVWQVKALDYSDRQIVSSEVVHFRVTVNK